MKRVKRAAAIDIGTNSVRLLVAERRETGLEVLKSGLVTTRLGKGIGSGMLQQSAMERTVDAVFRFYQMALKFQPERVVTVATSAVRDASNRSEFLDAVWQRTGLRVRVLSGEEEAALSYQGVLLGVSVEPRFTAVVDIGGGSTELIWTQDDGRLRLASVNVGAVRATEEGMDEDEVAARLVPVLGEIRRSQIDTLVGVGGTVTALAAVDQCLAVYDPGQVHGYCLKAGNVANILERLKMMDLGERKKVAGLQPERADIIVAGAVIAGTIMKGLGVECMLVSECDILCALVKEEVEIK